MTRATAMRHPHGGENLPAPGRLPHAETSRVGGLLLGGAVAAALVVAVMFSSGRMTGIVLGGADDFDQRMSQRDRYLSNMCGTAPVGGEDLCACVHAAEDPARDCTAPYHAWAVSMQADRCRDAQLRSEAEAYCDCVDEVARAVEAASDPLGRRRASQRHEVCEAAGEALPLP
jgi:hypothetical protein